MKALNWLLAENNPNREYDGIPFGCSKCPFAGTPDPNYNIADPDEGMYPCSLLNKEVWGENPKCTLDDWRRKAREELGR